MKQFEPLGPLSVLRCWSRCSARCIIISLDLGQPLRVYRFLVTPSFSSMLTWLVVFIMAMWVIYLSTFYLLLRADYRSVHDDQTGRKIFVPGLGPHYYAEERAADPAGSLVSLHQHARRPAVLRRARRLVRRS